MDFWTALLITGWVFAGWGLIRILLSFLLIQKSAKRMSLRDKGKVYDETGTRLVHTWCGTPARIGINAQGEAKRYCWKCEKILRLPNDTDPDDEKGLPEENSSEVAVLKGSSVVPFRRQPKSAA